MRLLLSVVTMVVLGATVGCQSEKSGPTYAELVMIYNSEAEALDRLEAKRAARVVEYEAALAPSGDAALAALSGMLADAKENPPADLNTADPDALLDSAIANAENLDAKTNELLEAAAQSGGKPIDRSAIEALYTPEFKAELAKLDTQIAEQQVRVEKARAARDAAEK